MKWQKEISQNLKILFMCSICTCLGFGFALIIQKREDPLHHIAIESDGGIDTMSKLFALDLFSGNSGKIFCYYLGPTGSLVRDGQELVFVGTSEIIDSNYRDGKKISSLTTSCY